jgi:tRNA (guanine37-N1)-methyltransferase
VRAVRIDIVTVFPEMVTAALDHSIIKRAIERKLVKIQVVNLRDFTRDRHKTTDDIPYGGGGGMVMKIEPIARALISLTGTGNDETQAASAPYIELNTPEPTPAQLSALAARRTEGGPRIVLTDPRGPRFTQETARRWAKEAHIVLLCGHYEGVDERVRQHLVTDEISIGDYILTGGELPALVITDALTRLQAGALGDADAPDKDTFAENLLEYPHYTRPRDFSGWAVPDILLCGHHAEIARWRRWRQLQDTAQRRPDLFERFELSQQDKKLMAGPEPTTPPDEKALRRADRLHTSDTSHSSHVAESPEPALTEQSDESFDQ